MVSNIYLFEESFNEQLLSICYVPGKGWGTKITDTLMVPAPSFCPEGRQSWAGSQCM